MKDHITFSEETAKKIIRQFSLSENTLKTWRNRGKIPGKYIVSTSKTVATKAEKITEKRILNVLQSKMLNITVVLQLSEIELHRYSDVLREKTSFSHEEIIRLKSEINKLKIEIVKTFSQDNIKPSQVVSLLKNSAFVLNVIMKDNIKVHRERANRIKLKQIEPSSLDISIIKDSFIKLALQLTV
jgi:hypothetical protein